MDIKQLVTGDPKTGFYPVTQDTITVIELNKSVMSLTNESSSEEIIAAFDNLESFQALIAEVRNPQNICSGILVNETPEDKRVGKYEATIIANTDAETLHVRWVENDRIIALSITNTDGTMSCIRNENNVGGGNNKVNIKIIAGDEFTIDEENYNKLKSNINNKIIIDLYSNLDQYIYSLPIHIADEELKNDLDDNPIGESISLTSIYISGSGFSNALPIEPLRYESFYIYKSFKDNSLKVTYNVDERISLDNFKFIEINDNGDTFNENIGTFVARYCQVTANNNNDGKSSIYFLKICISDLYNVKTENIINTEYNENEGIIALYTKTRKINLTYNKETKLYSYTVEKIKEINLDNILTKDNTTPFTPDSDYEPATKKYVDDYHKEYWANDISSTLDCSNNSLYYTYHEANIEGNGFKNNDIPPYNTTYKIKLNFIDELGSSFISAYENVLRLYKSEYGDSEGNSATTIMESDNYRILLHIFDNSGSADGFQISYKKLAKEVIVTESEYTNLGSSVNTNNVLYFVTPDA